MFGINAMTEDMNNVVRQTPQRRKAMGQRTALSCEPF